MKYCHHLLRPFGAGCRLAPQAGYTRVMINGIRTMCAANSFDGALPTHDTLVAELVYNPMWNRIQLLSNVCWVNPMVAISKSHSSIVVSFLDVDGSLLKAIVKQPPFMFGDRTMAKPYVSMPLLRTYTHCHSLRHNVEHCAKKSHITICVYRGGHHKSKDHAVACIHKSKYEIAGICNCAPSCLNCCYEQKPCAGHYANDVNCPLRKKFRMETHRSGDTTDEER